MATAYISLGSNMGDPRENLYSAINYLKKDPNLSILKTSSVYFTEPQGLKDQPWFANQVIKVDVKRYTPITLLQKLLKIENVMGRKRDIRWGPRIIDLDLILFDNFIIHTSELVLPHPRMFQRAFVLVPLLEIEPYLTSPRGKKISFYLEKLNYKIKDNRIWQYD